MVVLYVIHSWSAVTCSASSLTLDGCVGFLTIADISSRTTQLPDALVYYGDLYVVSILTGLLFGGVYYHILRSGQRIPRKNLWPYYFRGIRNSGAEPRIERLRDRVQDLEHRLFSQSDGDSYYVRVHTTEGRAIDGKIDQEGQVSQRRDIVLQDPTILEIDGDDEAVIDDWTGSVYIHEQGISYVQFDELGSADSTPRKQEKQENIETGEVSSREAGSSLQVDVEIQEIDDEEINELREKLDVEETEETESKD